VDVHGDPLPEGALARLGTIRFRDANFIAATAPSPDGKLLALSNTRGILRLLDATTGREVRRFHTAGGFLWMSFSPDSKLLAAVVGHGDSILFWDVATGKAIRQLRPPDQSRLSSFVVFSADGKYIAAAKENHGQDKPAAYVWE